VKFFRARPWLLGNFIAIVVCVFGLVGGSDTFAVVLYWLALAASVSLGVIIELSYRRKLREQQR